MELGPLNLLLMSFFAVIPLVPAPPLLVPEVQTTAHDNVTGSRSTEDVYTPISVLKNCSLIPENDTLSDVIAEALKEGVSMMEIKFKFREKDRLPSTLNGKSTSVMFKPFFWVRTTGRFGTRLLLLKPNYDVMSFKSLEIKVKKYKKVRLNEYPEECMDGLEYADIELILRELIMNNFRNTTEMPARPDPNDRVCNLHIRDDDGADFRYYCCHRDETLNISCNYLQSDKYLDLMHFVMTLIKAAFILFCPLLVPASFIHTVNEDDCYRYNLEKPLKLMLKLVRKKSAASTVKKNDKTIIVDLAKIRNMTKLKELVQDLPNNEDKLFTLNVAKLQTKKERLVNTGEAPAGIVGSLYEFLFKCRVRELSSVNMCCKSDICPTHHCSYSWYKLGRVFMRLVLGVLLLTPWAIRMFVYYRYEHKELTLRKDAADEKGYSVPFPGNLTCYFTPLHGMFIFIYVVLFVETFVFGIIGNKTKSEMMSLFRKCSRDMSKESRTKAFGGFVKLLLLPFTTLGCWVILGGVFMWTVLIPLALTYLFFHVFPTVNLSIRLLYNFISKGTASLVGDSFGSTDNDVEADNTKKEASKDEDRTKRQRSNRNTGVVHSKMNYIKREIHDTLGEISLLQNDRFSSTRSGWFIKFLIIIFCLIFTYSCIILMVELATFFMDIFLYTLIGLIVYADYTMTYISLIVLLLVYAKDCFGGVAQVYRKYSSTLNRYIMSLCEKQAFPVFYEKSETQRNKAFVVKPCIPEDDPCTHAKRTWPSHNDVKLFNHSGKLMWNVRKVAFFLNNKDVPKIPSKLLFDASTMTYANTPGRLVHRYLYASLSFVYIVAFLFFVFLVVMAFGETGKISATNQYLATIAGGILPFLLKKFLFKSHEVQPIDAENDINFRVAIHDLINEYEQNWLVYDMELNEESTFHSGHTEEAPDQIEHSSSERNSTDLTDKLCLSSPDEENVLEGMEDDIIHLIIEYQETSVDKFDFPKLCRRILNPDDSEKNLLYNKHATE